MSDRILLVDDEPNVLHGYQRALRKQFQLDVASGGAEALDRIATDGPFAVVVCDMRMPEMNGVQLLAAVKRRAPDTVRMMLTGNSDQQTAIDAINEGDIFRFLNKPCDKGDLGRALRDGIRQYQLIMIEKELLQKTLAGSIRVLAEVLALADPAAFGRTARLQKRARSIIEQMGIEREWWLEPAVLLSQVGCITLPDRVSRKVASGESLEVEEYRLYARHPEVGAELIAKIPRMEQIAACIRYQEKNFDGTGVPHDGTQGNEIPMGARILKVALDYDSCDAAGMSPEQCVRHMQTRSNWYDPVIFAALEKVVLGGRPPESVAIRIRDLREEMVLAEDVRTRDGMLLIAKGLTITHSVRQRLWNYHGNGVVSDEVNIRVQDSQPLETEAVVTT